MKIKTKDVVQISLFASLTAVLSQLLIPIPYAPAPINLALISVFLAGGLLGGAKGAMSQFIYVLLGAIGLPVFSKFSSGLGVLIGPAGGYLIGYIVSAYIIGLLISRDSGIIKTGLIVTIGLFICYFTGTTWFMYITKADFFAAIHLSIIPYIIGDFFKAGISIYLLVKMKKIIKSYII